MADHAMQMGRIGKIGANLAIPLENEYYKTKEPSCFSE
jgi:hypothetical protein